MTRAARRPAERGLTLIEVMVAVTVLLVAGVGFVLTINYAATANGVAHRRTTTTLLRSRLIDRLVVLPRGGLATAPSGTWVVDSCHGVNAELLGTNASRSTSYACPAGTLYRSWINVTPDGITGWQVRLYVERTDSGCTAAQRYSAIGCSPADLLLTD